MYQLAEIPLTKAHASPTNPRKHFAPEPLAELAASIAEKGILQPLLVRELAGKVEGWEVVCGERRRRAALIAKLKEIPVSIAVLTDTEALELQIVENSQRVDVHPLEEADGFAALQKAGRSVEQIATKVAKSTSHVYRRLRLCTLVEEARTAFWDGKIDAAVAQVITNIHNPDLQAKATKELLEDARFGAEGAVNLADAKDLVRRSYMLVLADAPFERDRMDLIPGVGSCGACPKRTGAQKELFAEEGKTDLCLDPACYEAKGDAAWNRAAAKAEEGGGRVLPASETKKVFPYNGAQIAHGSEYTPLGAVCFEDDKRRTYGQLLGARAKDETILARDPQGGIHKLVKKATAIALLKSTHKAVAKDLEEQELNRTRGQSDRKNQIKEQARRRLLTTTLIGEVTRNMTAGTFSNLALDPAHWRLIAKLELDNANHDARSFVVKRRGLETPKGKRPEQILGAHLAELPDEKLPAFVLELLVTHGAYFSYSDKLGDGLSEAAKVLGVDVAAVKKNLAAIEREKIKAKREAAHA